MRALRYRHREPEISAVQVTPEDARAIAVWCGGWATDDLRWSGDRVPPENGLGHYLYPSDHPEFPDGCFYSQAQETPGSVMLAFGVVVKPGDWVVLIQGQFTFRSDRNFRDEFEAAPVKLSMAQRRERGLVCSYPEAGGGGHVEYCNGPLPCREHDRQ